ncbi:MAG TPA: hypothetical protein VJ828_07925 [Lacipirellulaceae bacterium]|nr:hypothetical protein [Lacipirellulaceae bacterium]
MLHTALAKPVAPERSIRIDGDSSMLIKALAAASGTLRGDRRNDIG